MLEPTPLQTIESPEGTGGEYDISIPVFELIYDSYNEIRVYAP